eukprot:gene12116-13366_t
MKCVVLSSTRPKRIVIRVGGTVFETHETTLSAHPDSLLGDPAKRMKYYDEIRGEFVFLRDARCFDAILFYYQSQGILRRPEDVDRKLFEQEVAFFEVSKSNFKSPIAKPDESNHYRCVFSQTFWKTLENPFSTKCSILISFVNILFILASVVVYCLATLPQLATAKHNTPVKQTSNKLRISKYHDLICIIEVFCMGLFTLEYFARLYNTQSRLKFISSTLSVIELLTITSFYCFLIVDKFKEENTALLGNLSNFFRAVCALQTFRFTRYSKGLLCLLEAILKALWRVKPIATIMPIMLTCFASLLFYAEENGPNEVSHSLFNWLWFVVITMTSVGYGDIYPRTILGKILGTFCALFGVLLFCFLAPTMLKYFFKAYYVPRYLKNSDNKETASLTRRLESFFH